ncbi:MAG: bifunctional oligoribonuclease/PAP phosphatase NrnA [Ignavibacteriaceae bacterium]|nr:bifunctional oligoribonuclease/PAP phosphatase NrnA [Ignavibacteriaceae bacterium]HRN26168.1 bifunctional oligoribonuclease/PAP phosphatase NrnA [Ignavibacteriaceae bacterium]HRQ54169.1 bifunctional oligoribonuclease/PAP phosphatase NrnA [Ignavibacteriaceae bacterium]
MIDFEKLKNIILSNSSFLLTTHVNPDADAIGSEIAFYHLLKKVGKKVFIINHSATPYNLEFFNKDNVIQKFDEVEHKKIFNQVDVLVALDFNRADRTVRMEDYFRSSTKLKICIDHHQDPEDFVDHQFIDTESCATGQIIYNLIKQTKIVELDFNIAEPIYAAIMTDTGSFRFDRTTSEVHTIIAELLKLGVNPEQVYDKLYDQSKFSKIKLLGRALNSITLFADNKLGYMVITQMDFDELSAVESDTENFVNYNLSIENVVLGILFIQLKNGFKVSFRSKGNIPVNKLANEFGGGGHTNAAGARFFTNNMQEMIPVILSKAELYLNN